MTMKTRMKAVPVAASLALAGLLAVPMMGTPSETQAGQQLRRLAAHFDYMTTEVATNNPATRPGDATAPGGLSIYSETLFVSSQVNTLYVTMSATGDSHGGYASWFTCIITDPSGNQSFCRPEGPGLAGNTPRGWVPLQKMPAANNGADNCNDGLGGAGDCHDNSIYYQWCTKVGRPGAYTVELRMAPSDFGTPGETDNPVFIEKAHFYIDGSKTRNNRACVQAPSAS